MARYTNRIPLTGINVDFVSGEVAKYMMTEGFSLIDYQGQKVWKKGMGIITAPQYMSLSFYADCVVVEGFIKFALFPGVYIGEMGTDGFFGAVPKGMLAGRIRQVESYLYTVLNHQSAQNLQAAQDLQAAQANTPPAGQ